VYDDSNEYKQELDFENCYIISLTPEKMVLYAGGDWQEQLYFTVSLEGQKLKVTDIMAVLPDGTDCAMENEELIKII
jgi:hypothetical protein